jgi:hypothetical protein
MDGVKWRSDQDTKTNKFSLVSQLSNGWMIAYRVALLLCFAVGVVSIVFAAVAKSDSATFGFKANSYTNYRTSAVKEHGEYLPEPNSSQYGSSTHVDSILIFGSSIYVVLLIVEGLVSVTGRDTYGLRNDFNFIRSVNFVATSSVLSLAISYTAGLSDIWTIGLTSAGVLVSSFMLFSNEYYHGGNGMNTAGTQASMQWPIMLPAVGVFFVVAMCYGFHVHYMINSLATLSSLFVWAVSLFIILGALVHVFILSRLFLLTVISLSDIKRDSVAERTNFSHPLLKEIFVHLLIAAMVITTVLCIMYGSRSLT